MEREWNRLLTNSLVDNVFLSWDYLHTWWTHFSSPRRKLLILAAQLNGELLGIAPLYLSEDDLCCKEIRFLGYGEKVNPDYLNFIVRSDLDGGTVRQSFLRHLLNNPQWDRLHLTGILQDHSLDEALDDLENDLNSIKQLDATCSFLTLPSEWKRFLETLSKKFRYRVKRRTKILLDEHKATLHRVEDEKDIRPTLDRLRKLHIERWSLAGERSRYEEPPYFEFHCKVTENLFRKGHLLLAELRKDNESLAILYCYLYNKKVFYYSGSFKVSSELTRYAPGNILRALLIQHAIERGCTEFDFLRGVDPYKEEWCNEKRNTYRYFIVRKGLRGHWINRDIRTIQIKRMIKAALRRLSTIEGVKHKGQDRSG